MEIGNRKWRFFCLGILVCASLSGCERAPEPKPELKPAVQKTFERGPIRLEISLDKNRVTVAEPMKLTISVAAPETFSITMPAPGEEMGSLSVKSATELPAPPIDGLQQKRQEYVLESLVSGEQTIPAMTIKYRDARTTASAPAAVEGELSSEPIQVRIASALKGELDPANLEHLRDIKGVVDVPLARSWRWVVWAALACALCLLLGFLLYRRVKHRVEKLPPPVPPGTWAFTQLRILEEERLIEQGFYHAFYSRLSDIVRQYIERRFSLMAPERTTEEFLREMRHSPVLHDDHQRLLRDFLESADRVKFALYEPGREEAENAFSAARNFVDETAITTTPGNGEFIHSETEEIGNQKLEIGNR